MTTLRLPKPTIHARLLMPARALPVLCVLSLAIPEPGWGQAIYRSVDAQGNVTYSNAPPAGAIGVEPVTVHRDTTPQGAPNAQRPPQEAERQASEAEKRRAEQKERAGRQAGAVAEAEKRLSAARQGLEAAKQQWDEDRRTSDRDNRIDNQVYRDRVNEERRKVLEAEQALEAAKTGALRPAESEEKAQPRGQAKGAKPPGSSGPAAGPGTSG